MNSINGNLTEHDDESDSLATWLREHFKEQQGTGWAVTLTDTQEQRETQR